MTLLKSFPVIDVVSPNICPEANVPKMQSERVADHNRLERLRDYGHLIGAQKQ